MLNKNQNGPEDVELDALRALRTLRFLSGEMTPEEQSLFEERLATNAALASLLSEVIELESAIESVAVFPVATPEVQITPAPAAVAPSTNRSVFPVLAAIAACVLVAVLVVPTTAPTNSHAVVENDAPVEHIQSTEFVDQWLDAVTASETEFVELTEPEDEPIELAMLSSGEVNAESEDIVPSWMLSAFEERAAGGGSAE